MSVNNTIELDRPSGLPAVHGSTSCKSYRFWFLGCLHGREEWKDKSVRPNFRVLNMYTPQAVGLCDAYEADPDPERQGRVLYEQNASVEQPSGQRHSDTPQPNKLP